MRILVVDDEPKQREMLSRGLFVFGHDVRSVDGIAAAAEMLSTRGPVAFDLVVTDIRAPDDPGVALIDVLRGVAPALPSLVITGLTDRRGLATLGALGTAVLKKPFTPEDLDDAVRAVARATPR